MHVLEYVQAGRGEGVLSSCILLVHGYETIKDTLPHCKLCLYVPAQFCRL